MQRFFVRNILFVIAVNLLVKPLWVLFIDRTVQNSVPAASYGTYQALFSLGIIFQTVLDFGISNYNSKTIAQHPEKLPSLFPAMLSARLVLMIIYIALACSWGVALGYRGWELSLLSGILLIHSLNALVSFIRSNVSALHRFKVDAMLAITDRMLAIAICGALLLNHSTARNFRIQWFVLAQIGSYFIATIAAYLVLRRLAHVKLRFSIDRKEILAVIRSSFPYALLIFLMSIYNRADAVMIERMCANGKIEGSIWAAAFRLLDMANILGLMFATMLLPVFGRMIKEKTDVQPIAKLCVNMMVPFAVSVAVGCFFFGGDIMYLLYHKNPLYPTHAAEYRKVFSCLMLSFPGWCFMYVYSTLLTANGSMKTLNLIAAAGVIFNLSLNLVLIPRYNALGGAITSLATQTGLALVFFVFAIKIFHLTIAARWLLAHLGYAMLIGCSGYFICHTDTGKVFQVLLLAAVSILSIFFFQFVSVKNVKLFMNRSVDK